MFPCKKECFGDAGSAEGCEERSLDFASCKRGTCGMVVGNHKGIIMLRKMRECEDVEDFIGEVCNETWFREICNRMLLESDPVLQRRQLADEPRIRVYPNSITPR